MSKEYRNRINILLTKYKEGSLSVEEREEIETSRKNDEGLDAAIREYKSLQVVLKSFDKSWIFYWGLAFVVGVFITFQVFSFFNPTRSNGNNGLYLEYSEAISKSLEIHRNNERRFFDAQQVRDSLFSRGTDTMLINTLFFIYITNDYESKEVFFKTVEKIEIFMKKNKLNELRMRRLGPSLELLNQRFLRKEFVPKEEVFASIPEEKPLELIEQMEEIEDFVEEYTD